MAMRRWVPLLLAALLLAAGCRWLVQRAPGRPAAPLGEAVQPAGGRAAVAALPFEGALRLSLLAGDGLAGLREGAAAQARFADPYGLARGRDGTLYIADAGDNNRIRRLTPAGQVDTVAGGIEGFRDGQGAAAAFHTPSGLAIDSRGTLYVADTGNHAIRSIAPDGTVRTLAGTGAPGDRDGPAAQAQFNGPLAVAVDGQGRVYVADTYNDRIRLITPDGQVSTLAGGERPGFADGVGRAARFDTPCGLALDAQGTLWVADTRNHAIRRVAADGTVSTLVRTDPQDEDSLLRRPLALAAAPDGALYVAAARRGALLRVSPDGRLRVLLGDGAQRLSRPTALLLGPDGALQLNDAASRRLQQLAAVAGSPGLQIDVIGPAAGQPLPATAGRWPLAPQQGWHEVVGTPGEVRGDGHGEGRDHLHDGLDVRGEVGATVLAIADAKVASPLASWGFGDAGEGLSLDGLGYIHMRVGRNARGEVIDAARFQLLRGADGRPERMRVRRGTRFHVGEPLGSINAMAHVHLSVGVPGYERDPLALGFAGFVDRQPPHIDGIRLQDASGTVLTRKVSGRLLVPRSAEGLQIVVDAWDQVDGNGRQRRLGLQTLGYQLLQADGRPAPGFEQPRLTLDFGRLPSDEQAVKLAYAADSGVTVHGSARTRFLYQLANQVKGGEAQAGRWSTAELPAGDYTLHIVARDGAGNLAQRGADLALRLQ